jgi:hypothetical protein
MNSYITTFKGKKLYLVDYDAFVEAHENDALNMSDNGYIIKNKNNALIIDNNVIGYAFENYKKMIPADQKRKWEDVFNYQPKVKQEQIITERPTVEAIASEGKKRLDEVSEVIAPVLEELVHNGEDALNQVVEVGAEALAAQMEASQKITVKATKKRAPRKRVKAE